MAQPEEVLSYIVKHDRDLAVKISPMRIYEGSVALCDHFGIDRPSREDPCDAGLDRILNEAKKFYNSN